MWTIILVGIIVIFILLVVGIFVFVSHLSSKTGSEIGLTKSEIDRAKGDGEFLVAKNLEYFASITNGYVFNDFSFKEYGGRSTQIDHILITRGGLFVVETKSHKGEIYGSIYDSKWMCNRQRYKDDTYFENPIKQNNGHIYYLKKILGKSAPKMYSVIIFPYADISEIHENCVYNLDDALKYIRDMTSKEKYPQAFVDRMYEKLVFVQNSFGITTPQHVQNMKRFHR